MSSTNLKFLPVSREDMQARGWDELDFLYISGDAYVDHPSFAPALICRLLEAHGYKVGIIAQPEWRNNLEKNFMKMGKPKLAVLVGAGNLDSMLAKLTANKKVRNKDAYSPGGKIGLRPDRATIVYSQIAKRLFNNMPLIIGGIEASLRRFVHYDYWADSLRRSILMDAQADLLIYGMGELQILEIAKLLAQGVNVNNIKNINGTCYVAHDLNDLNNFVELPSWQEINEDKLNFAKAFKLAYQEQDAMHGKILVQAHEKGILIQNPPARPLSTQELDEVYELNYTRQWHPSYDALGGVPALSEVKFSITAHRGCFGSCAFCAIHAHQGRIIQARSDESIIREIKILTKLPDFKGYIHDVGGPTANFHHVSCHAQLKRGVCKNKECLFPEPCRNLDASHESYLNLLRKCRAVKGVKKIFVRSGLRYDYLLCDKKFGREFLEELCEHHVSGQLKVAPEHASAKVLKLMRKCDINKYKKFAELYDECNRKLVKAKKLKSMQYLVPYFMTSHPGAGLNEAIELGEFAAELNFCPEQAQDFIPTPGSLATCMYYSGVDPFTGQEVYCEKRESERKVQRALLQHRMPKNKNLVIKALKRAGVVKSKMI
ncbi:MAG: YgiQ family radical SAM protein [Synergistaceae bacterium]|nr:YgiQ family radical SAM protein [Synergistaceae bacterium]